MSCKGCPHYEVIKRSSGTQTTAPSVSASTEEINTAYGQLQFTRKLVLLAQAFPQIPDDEEHGGNQSSAKWFISYTKTTHGEEF